MITYLDGNALKPVGNKPAIIAHISNNHGGWGSGFVLAINEVSDKPRILYTGLFGSFSNKDPVLGDTQIVMIDPVRPTFVANMVAQNGTGPGKKGERVDRVDRKGLAACLTEVYHVASRLNATVHCPMFGAGLGGAKWEDMEAVLQMCNNNFPEVDTIVYRFTP